MSRSLLPALVLVALSGCGGGEDGPRETPSRSELLPGVAARIDSGNAAYRAREFEDARRHYRKAAELDPDLSTAWYGVYMAETALGNEVAADSALERAGNLGNAAGAHHPAPGKPTLPPGHPDPADPGPPPGHPQPSGDRGVGTSGS